MDMEVDGYVLLFFAEVEGRGTTMLGRVLTLGAAPEAQIHYLVGLGALCWVTLVTRSTELGAGSVILSFFNHWPQFLLRG